MNEGTGNFKIKSAAQEGSGWMKKTEEIDSKFRELFGKKPYLVRSPGRINLLGEHTDYNEGFVLPAAIDRFILFALAPREDKRVRLYAIDLRESFEFSLEEFFPSEKTWPNYLMGVCDQLRKKGLGLRGFDCVFGGNIPIGAGLSSSAAIEAGLAFGLNEIFGLAVEKLELVKLSQKAENEFVGVRCGIMDQFVNIFGAKDKVLKLDCRSLEFEYYPLILNDTSIVLCDTRVKRSLASSEYNRRRAQCEAGVKALQKFDEKIRSLRDVTMDFLEEHRQKLDQEIFKRCHYVVAENERLLEGCEDLKRGDLVSFGKRMYKTHAGLRDEYQVSCPELDLLVEKAAEHPAVIGSRMMGGGFGGCTINLVRNSGREDFIGKAIQKYKAHSGMELQVYVVKIEDGTSFL